MSTPRFIVVNEVDGGPVGIPVHDIRYFMPDDDKDSPRLGHTFIETSAHEFVVTESFLKVAEYIKEATS